MPGPLLLGGARAEIGGDMVVGAGLASNEVSAQFLKSLLQRAWMPERGFCAKANSGCFP
jgi:hypothetical protein